MKKICMVTTSEIYHDTRILNEAEVLSKKYELTILARKYPSQKHQKLPFKKMRLKLIDFYHLPLFQLNIFSSLSALLKAAFRENPDIYHAHDLDGLLCAFPAALIKRKVLIYDSHELWSDTYPFSNLKGIQWLLPLLERLLIWRIYAGITVNESLAKYLSHKYGKGFISLYNVAVSDKNRKSPVHLRKAFPDKKIILHLGAADEGRGLEQIIQAARFLKSDYVLVFVGGGKTETQAEILAEELGLSNIYFFPAVTPEEIIATVKQSDITLALTQKVSKSYYYSLPNKIFQYLAAQTPILGSNFPEFKKIILKNDIGQVVDPSKPKLIAQKIIEMLRPKAQKKYRHNLERLAKTRYNWEAESKKLQDFYAKVFFEQKFV